MLCSRVQKLHLLDYLDIWRSIIMDKNQWLKMVLKHSIVKNLKVWCYLKKRYHWIFPQWKTLYAYPRISTKSILHVHDKLESPAKTRKKMKRQQLCHLETQIWKQIFIPFECAFRRKQRQKLFSPKTLTVSRFNRQSFFHSNHLIIVMPQYANMLKGLHHSISKQME